jgi:hypothetical protein
VDYNIRGAWFINLTGVQHTINMETSLSAGRTKLKGWDGEKPAIIIT